MENNELKLIFGERAVESLQERKQLEYQIDKLMQENELLEQLSKMRLWVVVSTGVSVLSLAIAFIALFI